MQGKQGNDIVAKPEVLPLQVRAATLDLHGIFICARIAGADSELS